MAKPAVILVGADKGGVGKTTVSRTLLDYFASRKVPTRAFDTEHPRGTLSRFHPDITDVVDVTSRKHDMVHDSPTTAAEQSQRSRDALVVNLGGHAFALHVTDQVGREEAHRP